VSAILDGRGASKRGRHQGRANKLQRRPQVHKLLTEFIADHLPPTSDTIFGRILRGEIATEFFYEDDRCVAFADINPQAPVHYLIVPRKSLVALSQCTDDDENLLGHLLIVAKRIADNAGVSEDGFRTVVNSGMMGGQEVAHLHIHVLGGRTMTWPPG